MMLGWSALIDAGLTHVEHLVDREGVLERWVFVASDGSSLVDLHRIGLEGRPGFQVFVFRPGPRPAGSTSTMREWVFDWERIYHDAAEVLADVAAIAG